MERTKIPKLRHDTVAKGDLNRGSLDCESGILPLSYCAPPVEGLRQLLPMKDLSNYVSMPILDKSSPATIQRVKALELSKRRNSPPGHFTMSLSCSCAWPIDLPDGLDPTCLHCDGLCGN